MQDPEAMNRREWLGVAPTAAMAPTVAARMSQAWIQFARTGDPNHKGIPRWPAWDAGSGPALIFDDVCTVKSHPDRAERELAVKG